MASGIFNPVHHTQIREGISLPIVLKGSSSITTIPPIFIVGDKAGAYAGALFTVARSATGSYSLVTKYPFPYLTKCVASLHAQNPAVNSNVCLGVPTKDSTTNKWTIPFVVYLAGSAADLTANDHISIDIEFSNSKVQP
jgi:hypothetical protein